MKRSFYFSDRISRWRPGFPVGTTSLQISALNTKLYPSVLGHTQGRLRVTVTVPTQTGLVEQPGPERDGSRLSSRSLCLQVTLHFCSGKYVKFCHKSRKNLVDNDSDYQRFCGFSSHQRKGRGERTGWVPTGFDAVKAAPWVHSQASIPYLHHCTPPLELTKDSDVVFRRGEAESSNFLLEYLENVSKNRAILAMPWSLGRQRCCCCCCC